MRAPCSIVILLLATLFTTPAVADIAIIAHPANPQSSLSEKEVQKIFLGRLRMFPDSNTETVTLDLPEESTLYSEFYEQIAKMNAAKVKRYRAYYLFSGKGRIPEQVDNQQAVIKKVMENPAAIGYVDTSEDLSQVKILLLLHH